jgi:hypothetical protein
LPRSRGTRITSPEAGIGTSGLLPQKRAKLRNQLRQALAVDGDDALLLLDTDCPAVVYMEKDGRLRYAVLGRLAPENANPVETHADGHGSSLSRREGFEVVN